MDYVEFFFFFLWFPTIIVLDLLILFFVKKKYLGDSGKVDPRLERKEELSDDFVSFWFSAAKGDVFRIRQLIARGINPNCVDYDKRSALHLAATQGHLSVFSFFLFYFFLKKLNI